MAGRPRKTTIIKDITEAGTPEEKKIIADILNVTEPVKADIETSARKGTVKVDDGTWLNVRNAPFGDIVDKLYNGDEVTIYDVQKGFGKISTTEDKWVNLAFII